MSKMLESFSPDADGFQFMWIILIVFMIGLGFSIERFVYIMLKSSSGRARFLADFGKLISSQQFDQALSLANATNLPIARVMAAIVGAKNQGRDGMQAACDAVFLTEAPRLTRYVSIISVMASISTLLGLMGTIYGLIFTFDAVANKPAAERPKALADGIAIAMGTTLLGLLSAVPLLVIVGILNMNSERLIQEMEEKGLKIINSLS
ncbi:MotA/TolQ/ExbB proton channel family protein [Fibrobacter sp.]|jgi:biopolymer transport protein ExbB/TolQ|uniref:MotA/TolQ/ExbB proton channel family protein n=1 Tax=Fibrobacter sp. TaxID=35828 RepID=UPI001B2E63FE|nr:MotA/TolQ/ExbB proton channel family protein [Fibrobacter sp.]MBO4828568.1 MotA/TolQ/ExbB proton channel family protein [Fibrobacter sp.]MBO7059997.1 MotA/TolQ/ExbB proton channel family protein [Fibrobacter sp.]MBO7105941.1 MotA/TolQ/ExbB proton channel family protein [Fibrobacter sp.]MBO7413353.1 MotA/TolQ/ExbB proton channel family protein [Fibrobacter sp.]MBQ3715703.1 MotA/TolQ/ExbB proton channel family protein [Fibrobacter sp.]